MSWAHLASGGAGGGMRWPNRHPHVLTSGMPPAAATCRIISAVKSGGMSNASIRHLSPGLTFIECVTSGRKPQRVTAQDAVAGLQIVEAEKQSVESGQVVPV